MGIQSILTSQQISTFYLTLCIVLQGHGVLPRIEIAQSPGTRQSPVRTASQSRKLFGIQLRPSAQALLSEVENLYGKTVVEADNTNSESKSALGDAASNVLPDGAPVISINVTSGKNEDSIVHELFHLKLFAQGHSTPPAIRIGNTGKTFDTGVIVHLIMGLVHGPLQHSLFFPEMRRMGFDPDGEQRETVLKAIRGGKFEVIEGLSAADRDRLLAMYFFEFSMHFTDVKLLSAMAGWFKNAGWIKPLAMGEAMVGVARKAYPYTPQTLIDTFVRCLNVLYEGESQFTFDQWVRRTASPLPIRIAVLNRLPVPPKNR